MYQKVCCMCRLVVLARSNTNILLKFDVFIAVAVVATALYFDLKGHSVMTWKNPKCIDLYAVKLWLLRKCSCFVKRYFLHRECKCKKMKLLSLNEDMKNHEYFVIWKLSEANVINYFSAWIIIASWTDCWKYFVLFSFCHLKGVRNLHLGGYSIVNLYDFSRMRSIENRSIENLWYNLW